MADGNSWDLHDVELPWWVDRPSLYRHVRAHIWPDETGLAEDGETLPDEERVRGESKIGWAPGAMDGVFGGIESAERVVDEIVRALCELTEEVTTERAAELYDLLAEHRAVDYIDPLLESVREEDLDQERLHAVARWLAKEAPDREPVKAGIALLGLFHGSADREVLLTLGRHEEFTLYSAVALLNTEGDPERQLYTLARHVTGWGRIQIVKRLAGTQDEEIKAWMLREGYQNNIMYEYTAYSCATTGDLLSALSSPEPDEALLKGAADILSALIDGRGGPAEGIGEYEDGAEATELFLERLRDRRVDFEQLVAVGTIKRFLEEEEGEVRDPALGWPQRRTVLLEHVNAILSRPGWERQVRRGLASGDERTFHNAVQAARVIGVDTWDACFERLERGEGGYWSWYFVMQTDNPERIDRVVALAEERLPLEQIATGPADELGLGPDFEHHSALGLVLQDLGPFPGKGWPLVRAGLQSQVVSNRNLAVRALAAWGREAWPEEAGTLLRDALENEPREDIRDYMRKVLAGEPLDS
jgi:hypothetical protein